LTMSVRRLGRAELDRIQGRGGYVLNVERSRVRIHSTGCPLIGLMNTDKRGGVFHSNTLEDATRWLEANSLKGRPCKVCLPGLTYKPRPGRLTDIVRA